MQKILFLSTSRITDAIDALYDLLFLVVQTIRSLPRIPFRTHEIIHQLYDQGNRSVTIVLFSITFAGFVVAIEYTYHMRLVLFTAEMVPAFASVMVFRDLAPALTALLLATKTGAGMAAEIGSMRVTEQIDALRLLHINPIEYLVVPRLIASIITTVSLALFAVVICLIGIGFVSVTKLQFTIDSFVDQIPMMLSSSDLWMLIVKAAVFGAVIPIISCYYGLLCKPSAKGVGEATTKAVVVSSILIIALDFVITSIFSVMAYS